MATLPKQAILAPWAAKRFEKKHSGFHRALLIAVPASVGLWLAALSAVGVFH